MTPRRLMAVEAVIEAARGVLHGYLGARMADLGAALAELDACQKEESLGIGTISTGEVHTDLDWCKRVMDMPSMPMSSSDAKAWGLMHGESLAGKSASVVGLSPSRTRHTGLEGHTMASYFTDAEDRPLDGGDRWDASGGEGVGPGGRHSCRGVGVGREGVEEAVNAWHTPPFQPPALGPSAADLIAEEIRSRRWAVDTMMFPLRLPKRPIAARFRLPPEWLVVSMQPSG